MTAERFCPHCRSGNVFIFALGWKCGDCGYFSLEFPKIEKKNKRKEK